MKTREEKLAAIEASMKRWITRQGRAATALAKLQRQKQRLLKGPTDQERRDRKAMDALEGRVLGGPDFDIKKKVETDSAIPLPELDAFFIDGGVKMKVTKKDDLAVMPSNQPKPLDAEDAFSIPTELKITTDVEALRAERRKKEAAERKAMPLTGKAALDYIKTPRNRRAKA